MWKHSFLGIIAFVYFLSYDFLLKERKINMKYQYIILLKRKWFVQLKKNSRLLVHYEHCNWSVAYSLAKNDLFRMHTWETKFSIENMFTFWLQLISMAINFAVEWMMLCVAVTHVENELKLADMKIQYHCALGMISRVSSVMFKSAVAFRELGNCGINMIRSSTKECRNLSTIQCSLLWIQYDCWEFSTYRNTSRNAVN